MRTGKLTLKDVARAKSHPGRYADGSNLYAQSISSSHGYWYLRFLSPVTRRERYLGLGSLSDVSLYEARERARKARRMIAEGIDPIERSTSTLTFQEAAERYLKDHGSKWSSLKHSKQFLSTLKAYAFPKIGKMNVANITTAHVLDVLRPIYATKSETAARLRMRCEWIFDWSIVNGYRSGENPARREIISAGLPRPARQVRHFASMAYQRVPQFVAKLRERDGIAARALEFLILTAARTNEVLGAKWTEFGDGIWTIPAERMKAREEHRVPLSDAALAILKELPREQGNDAVFIGPRNDHLSSAAMSALLERMGESVTVHGFRSSLRTWAEEQTTHPHIVAEMALAHRVDDKLVRTYRRTDLLAKRRALMNDWADYLTEPKVVALRSKVV